MERGIAAAGGSDYDMEIINNLYKDNAQVFHWTNHTNYLGDPDGHWDPEAVLKEAKFLHFYDWPIPKVLTDLYSLES